MTVKIGKEIVAVYRFGDFCYNHIFVGKRAVFLVVRSFLYPLILLPGSCTAVDEHDSTGK